MTEEYLYEVRLDFDVDKNEYCLVYGTGGVDGRIIKCYIPRNMIHFMLAQFYKTIKMVEGKK